MPGQKGTLWNEFEEGGKYKTTKLIRKHGASGVLTQKQRSSIKKTH
jgi:hypothetical protein